MIPRGGFPHRYDSEGQAGRALPYKEPSAIVVAGFQPAIIAFRVGMSLGASESDE